MHLDLIKFSNRRGRRVAHELGEPRRPSWQYLMARPIGLNFISLRKVGSNSAHRMKYSCVYVETWASLPPVLVWHLPHGALIVYVAHLFLQLFGSGSGHQMKSIDGLALADLHQPAEGGVAPRVLSPSPLFSIVLKLD